LYVCTVMCTGTHCVRA